MKKLTSFILILFLSIMCYGQSQKSFDKLIKKLNDFSNSYDTLYPGPSETYYDLSDFKLTKYEKQQIIEANYTGTSPQLNDSIDSFSMISYFKEQLINILDQIFNHPKFESNLDKPIFNNTSLFIINSEDKKLFNVHFDGKNGGSYKDRVSLIYHFGDNKLYSNVNINMNSLLMDDGYQKIYQIKTSEGTKYVLIGSSQTCNTCSQSYLKFVTFKNDSLHIDFQIKVDTRGWNNIIEYNPIDSIITVKYETSDHHSYCSCEQEQDYADQHKSNFDYSKRKECICQFKLINSNFELVKESWEQIEK